MVRPEPAQGLVSFMTNAASRTPIWLPSRVVQSPRGSPVRGKADADPVGVRIAGEHEVGAGGPGLGDGRVECPGDLGIGDMARNIGKVAVGGPLRGQNVDLPEARGLEQPATTEVSPTPCIGV